MTEAVESGISRHAVIVSSGGEGSSHPEPSSPSESDTNSEESS